MIDIVFVEFLTFALRDAHIYLIIIVVTLQNMQNIDRGCQDYL